MSGMDPSDDIATNPTFMPDGGNRYAVLLPRHCERSEAIHRAASKEMDCFAALAMTWICLRILATCLPEACIVFALAFRGRREDRVLAAPEVPRAVCAWKEAAHGHTGTGGSIQAFPAQWLYGL